MPNQTEVWIRVIRVNGCEQLLEMLESVLTSKVKNIKYLDNVITIDAYVR